MQQREPYSEAEKLFARQVRAAVYSQTGPTSKFVGWWLLAIGGALAVLFGHANDATQVIGAIGFIATTIALAVAGLAGLVSEYVALASRTQVAVAEHLIQALPDLVEMGATHWTIQNGRQLALIGQPWIAKWGARHGEKIVHSLPAEVRDEGSYVLAARSATFQRLLAQTMVALTTLSWIIAVLSLLANT